MKALYKTYPKPGQKVRFNCAPHTEAMKLLRKAGKPLTVIFQEDGAYVLVGLNTHLPYPHEAVGFYRDMFGWFMLEGE